MPVTCTPGDNLAVHVAVAMVPAGSVLVVDGGTVLVDPGTVGFDYRLSRRPPAQ